MVRITIVQNEGAAYEGLRAGNKKPALGGFMANSLVYLRVYSYKLLLFNNR